MIQLTKRYAVIHLGKNLMTDQIEYELGTCIFPAEGVEVVEFDAPDEAEQYISDNELVYEFANKN